jgi:hypothetical protein
MMIGITDRSTIRMSISSMFFSTNGISPRK